MNPESKIYVAGHRGLVGSAILRQLKHDGFVNIITKSRAELDLLDLEAVQDFFSLEKPQYIFLAAAKVGGIAANQKYIADFIYQNLQIQNNVIHCAHLFGVKKLIFLGSSCIYPKFSPQPIKEEYILSGPLEPTNYGYAVAKIAGVKMCESYHQQYGDNFLSLMPTNIYGIGDNFNLENSHVLPALIRKFCEAKINNSSQVEVWGSGKPRREFLYSDDLAEACIFMMKSAVKSGLFNVGVGDDISIADLALLIQEITGFAGEICFNPERPDGTPRKVLDVSKINTLGWRAKTGLRYGISKTYEWFLQEKLGDNFS